MFLLIDPATKGLSTLEMPRESSSAPTLEAGVPEMGSHSSISSKVSSDDRFACASIVDHDLPPCFQFHSLGIVYSFNICVSFLGNAVLCVLRGPLLPASQVFDKSVWSMIGRESIFVIE